MSEYQYYEFQAIDRPLTAAEIRELRSVSTRASITPTRFVNEYEWGDFKGNPIIWIEKYFDAFFYYANWGSREFMLRLPGGLLDYGLARRYCCGDAAAVRRKGDFVILEFHSEDEGADWIEDETELSALLPIRVDLARGDYRSLYLAWLLCVQAGEVKNDVHEPPLPAGLQSLSGSLAALADFLRIDRDLIEVAAEMSPDRKDIFRREDMARWIRSLPDSEKVKMLCQAALDGCNPERELQAKFRASQAEPTQTANPRTVSQILKAVQDRAESRRQRAKEHTERDRLRHEEEARAARDRYLIDLEKQGQKVWVRVEQLIATKQPRKYDEAVALLQDLSELALRDGNGRQYADALRRFQKRHEQKPSLIGRLRKAGLLDSAE